MRIQFLSGFFIILLLIGCESRPVNTVNKGPILLQESTLVSATAGPTRFITDTPLPRTSVPQSSVTPVVTNAAVSGVATESQGFVLVTPTLPPSKTPTTTPTVTNTLIPTTTSTHTATPTATVPVFPTSFVVPVTGDPNVIGVGITPLAGSTQTGIQQPPFCEFVWFFTTPTPPTCARGQAASGQGVFQEFERGYMIWVGAQDAIYVLYEDTLTPSWQVVRDDYTDGIPETDPAFMPPSSQTWQPRRGFGYLWRNNASLRERIGWATQDGEDAYIVQTQTATDGTLYINNAFGNIFGLAPGGASWLYYDSVSSN